jgi:hypothetical protein
MIRVRVAVPICTTDSHVNESCCKGLPLTGQIKRPGLEQNWSWVGSLDSVRCPFNLSPIPKQRVPIVPRGGSPTTSRLGGDSMMARKKQQGVFMVVSRIVPARALLSQAQMFNSAFRIWKQRRKRTLTRLVTSPPRAWLLRFRYRCAAADWSISEFPWAKRRQVKIPFSGSLSFP